MPDESPI